MNKHRRQGKKKKGKYLFNTKAMAKVFRARFPAALNESGLCIPKNIPDKWVVDCAHVGKGITALKYLSRYLYRGVISEKNIVSNQNGQVTLPAQLILQVVTQQLEQRPRPVFKCPCCQSPMVIPGFRRIAWKSG